MTHEHHLGPPPRPDPARRHREVLTDAEFTHSVLANSIALIKVLDLDARIELVSVGALRALEVADEDALISSSWFDLWPDASSAQIAVADAKGGRSATFEGERPTVKGNPRWWEVTVSPILGLTGRPARLLTVSRDITTRKVAPRSQAVLTHDMHHRVKNLLAMVMAIASQSLARAPSIEDGRVAIERRLMALAEAHNVLREGTAEGVSLRSIVDAALAPYDAEPSRFEVEGEDVHLSPRAALAVAMALHELCTNAIKYGALSIAGGRVALTWRNKAGHFHMTWREHGGPQVEGPARRGFGTRVIEANFRNQLAGSATVSFAPTGVVWSFEANLRPAHA